MHLIRFLIIFLIIVQFTSSSDPSTTTNKPKTSFTRHLNKIFLPLKKLFSLKPKNNTQSPPQSSTQSSNIDQFNKNESVDQLISNSTNSLDSINTTSSSPVTVNSIQPFNELNLLINNTIDLIDLNISDSIDLIEELNLKSSNHNNTNDVRLNSTTNNDDEIDKKSSHLETTTYNVPEVTTPIYETTTNLIFRRKAQKLKEDEIRICFEIEELNVRKCYIQIPTTANFIYSRNYCEQHFQKGRLITINSQDEQNFLILNNVYYFWTAFKVKLGLTSDLIPYIAAIKPIYRQSNSSIELIKKFDFNQNLIVSQTELNSMISNDKFTSFATNDLDAYDLDDIRIDDSAKSPIFVILPKLYCLEASLNFENGSPLYKWVVKNCEHEISSSVCELSEPIVEEYNNFDSINKPSNELEEQKLDQIKNEDNALVDQSVNKLVNDFLNKPSNGTKDLYKLIRTTTEPNHDFEFESTNDSPDLDFKSILSEIIKDQIEKTTVSDFSSTTLLNTSTFKPMITTEMITELTTGLTTESITKLSTQETTIESTETTTISIKSIEPKTEDDKSNKDKIETCDNERNPLVYQFVFAIHLSFKTLCNLIINLSNNLFKQDSNDVWNMKMGVEIFLICFIILIMTILLSISLFLIFRCIFRLMTRKRRLLLDQLSEQRNKKDFTITIDKKDDDSCYYNIPQNRNIYVSNPQMMIKKIDTEKYKSIPKEYFY